MDKKIRYYPSLWFWLIFISALPLLFSCDYRTERSPENTTEPPTEVTTTPEPASGNNYNYAVFLENSGSMDGYVRGTTAFEDDIYKLLVDISYLADTVQVHYINTQIIPYQKGIQDFINHLEPDTFRQRGGNRSSSNINQVLSRVLQEMQEDKVNILISDFIFSTGGGNTEEKLDNQKISIYNTFRSRLQEAPFATLILKMNSEFNGSYYNKNDQPVALSGVKRPYYIWLIGPVAAIDNFRSQVKLNQLEGFEYTYLLMPENETSVPYFTVLNNYHKTGSFRADRNFSDNGYVRGISNIEPAHRGETEGQFGFSIAIDMSHVPVDEDYLLNIENYEVTEAYQLTNIQSIEEIDDMQARDKTLIEGKITHILTLAAKGKSYPDVQIALKKQTPAWITATQTKDDTGIKRDSTQLNKTFGFGYLVGGIEEAYQNLNKQDTYFSIEISVKK